MIVKVGAIQISRIAPTPVTANERGAAHDVGEEAVEVAVGGDGVGGRRAELTQHRGDDQRQREQRDDPAGDVEQGLVGSVGGAEAHHRRGDRDEPDVDRGGDQLGEPARPRCAFRGRTRR